jgi:hypothetical protein
MAQPGSLLEINWEAETLFGEDVDTVATSKMALCAPVDTSGLVQKKVDPQRVVSYRGDLGDWIRATYEGTFKTKSYLVGHESTTAGAITKTNLETLLGHIFANAVTTATGSTLTGGTANIATTTDSGTLDPGDLCFIGALGDGDGEGQCYPIATHTAQNLTLLVDMQGAPANGAVRYGGVTIYPNSDGTSASNTVQSLRMAIATAGMQYLCHGCFPTSVVVGGLNPGELPYIEITWMAAWWEYKASTFPSALSASTANPAATAAGSLVVNTVGTTTNSSTTRRSYRSLSINITLGVVPLRGPGGVNAFQDIIGCTRGEDACELTWSEDVEATTTSPELPGFGTATNRKHAILTLSTTDGSRIAFYWPSLRVTNIAAQEVVDGLNRFTVKCMAGVGPTNTSALTLSKWRMHSA